MFGKFSKKAKKAAAEAERNEAMKKGIINVTFQIINLSRERFVQEEKLHA